MIHIEKEEWNNDLPSLSGLYLFVLPWAYVTIEDLSENGSQESLFPEREMRSFSSSERFERMAILLLVSWPQLLLLLIVSDLLARISYLSQFLSVCGTGCKL
jgi:hypothetical protein